MLKAIDDDSNRVVLPINTACKTTWTLLIYLTDQSTGCTGGETVFYGGQPAKHHSGLSTNGEEAMTIAPEVGMGLLHKHGNDCLLHEGKEVTAGEKWVIRSDLCVKL